MCLALPPEARGSSPTETRGPEGPGFRSCPLLPQRGGLLRTPRSVEVSWGFQGGVSSLGNHVGAGLSHVLPVRFASDQGLTDLSDLSVFHPPHAFGPEGVLWIYWCALKKIRRDPNPPDWCPHRRGIWARGSCDGEMHPHAKGRTRRFWRTTRGWGWGAESGVSLSVPARNQPCR